MCLGFQSGPPYSYFKGNDLRVGIFYPRGLRIHRQTNRQRKGETVKIYIYPDEHIKQQVTPKVVEWLASWFLWFGFFV